MTRFLDIVAKIIAYFSLVLILGGYGVIVVAFIWTHALLVGKFLLMCAVVSVVVWSAIRTWGGKK